MGAESAEDYQPAGKEKASGPGETGLSGRAGNRLGTTVYRHAESDTEDGDNIDDVQDDSKAQTEAIDFDADGDEVDDDVDNDGETNGTENDIESNNEDDDHVDDEQDDGEVKTEETDSDADGNEADGDVDNDDETQDDDVTCSHVGKESDHQHNGLGENTHQLHQWHQREHFQPGGYARGIEDVGPIMTVATNVGDEEGDYGQRGGDGQAATDIGSCGENGYEAQHIAEKDKPDKD